MESSAFVREDAPLVRELTYFSERRPAVAPQSRPKEIERDRGGLAKADTADTADGGLAGKVILLRTMPVGVG